MIVFLNGKFVKAEAAKVSIFDHGFLYGDGVYETLRTYTHEVPSLGEVPSWRTGGPTSTASEASSIGGKIWQLPEHLKRLQRSADFLGLKIPYNLSELARLAEKTVALNGFKESRIRITLTRGENGYDFGSCEKPTLCIQVQELKAEPAAVYEHGVEVVTFAGVRNLPEAKTISLLPLILANRFLRQKKAYEAIFVDGKGLSARVLEGTITNIFLVKNGVLITPKTGMLSGTTRQFLLKIARQAGFKISEKNMKVRDLYLADEVFITNAPRGIIPVVKVDGRKVGKGRPGTVTKSLMGIFLNYLGRRQR